MRVLQATVIGVDCLCCNLNWFSGVPLLNELIDTSFIFHEFPPKSRSFVEKKHSDGFQKGGR